MSKCYLFSYGTLQVPLIQRGVVGRSLPILSKNYKISGFTLSKIIIEDCTYECAIVADLTSCVNGMVFEIDSFDLKLLDDFETESYKRVICTFHNELPIYMYIKNYN